MSSTQKNTVMCFFCKETGHKLDVCPKIRCRRCHFLGHTDRDCHTKICDFCKKQGHIVDECRRIVCTQCGEQGHFMKDCTKPPVCRYCKNEGHLVDVCPNMKCKFCKAVGHTVRNCTHIGPPIGEERNSDDLSFFLPISLKNPNPQSIRHARGQDRNDPENRICHQCKNESLLRTGRIRPKATTSARQP